MLLTVGVGNTSIKFGIFDKDKLLTTWHIATDIHRMPDEYAIILMNLLQHEKIKAPQITDVAMWCVVPPLFSTFEELFGHYFNINLLIVGAGVKTGVRIRMDNPREVGADRIVNAAAAHYLYEGPIIILDMGTATTFDTISKEGDYIGGVIAPGIMMAAEAVVTRPAQLFRVQLVTPKKVIGTNTIAAMQSGIIFGYTGLVEGLIARIRQELGVDARVVATGGYANLIARETKAINIVTRTSHSSDYGRFTN